MSQPHRIKTLTTVTSTDRAERLQGRAARARRKHNATQYDWRNEVREVAPLLSVRRVLVNV
jgi:hypothetical protein